VSASWSSWAYDHTFITPGAASSGLVSNITARV
jgi:hypothetical protein